MAYFSIIITAYNCQDYIVHALDSIYLQSFTDYEVVVIEDCSKDSTLKLITAYIKDKPSFKLYANETNQGVVSARNKGIDIASGEYICILDGDDIWATTKLEQQKKVFDETQADLCYTSYQFINQHGQLIKKPYVVSIVASDYSSLLKENYIGCSTVAVRTNILKQNKFTHRFAHEDYALWLTLQRKGCKMVGIKDVLVNYRVTKGSRSYNKIMAAKHRLDIYRKSEGLSFFKSTIYMITYFFHAVKKHYL